jgi:hypothetical protein
MFTKLSIVLVHGLQIVLVIGLQAEPNVLIGNKSTEYCIYHEAEAPASVRDAAEEVQRILARASGVKLAIATKPSSPMIALGDSQSAREAGLTGSGLPMKAFVSCPGATTFSSSAMIPRTEKRGGIGISVAALTLVHAPSLKQ